MKHIAVIFEGGLDHLTGLTNAVLSRVKYLKETGDFVIDVYDILACPFGLTRLYCSKSRFDGMRQVSVDGLNINVMWHRRILIDDVMNFKLHVKPVLLDRFLHSKIEAFKNYDLISAHAFVGAKLAYAVHQKYGTPFCVTWHGSDIHSIPQRNHYQIQMTRRIIEAAAYNFFVSKNLMQVAQDITTEGQQTVLYNGVSPIFQRYDKTERQGLRAKHGVEGMKVIAFVGNLKPVKNVRSLPDIFQRVAEGYKGSMAFWIIGGGEERQALEQALSATSLNYRLWGHQPVEVMPELMQCMDVLVLPSKNEGLPLVLAEAISCGANAVGARVGGIPEVIGQENSVPHGDGFAEAMASRIIYYLMHNEPQAVDAAFNWHQTAKTEAAIYHQILEK